MQKPFNTNMLFEAACKQIIINIPIMPEVTLAHYRYFNHGEHHINRISKEFVLLFIIESTLCFSENNIPIEIKSGEWYLQLPGLKQTGPMGSPGPSYFYIHFNACASPADNTLYPPMPALSEDRTQSILLPIRGTYNIKDFKPLFDELNSLSEKHPPDILRQQAVFLSIFNRLYNISKKTSAKEDLSIQVMNYLAANYTSHISSDMLSSKFHFSPDYITRKMKLSYGITPCQYIQLLRIKRAKELLSLSDYTLNEICQKIGYGDISVFYKAFVKHTGSSPGEWRKANRI